MAIALRRDKPAASPQARDTTSPALIAAATRVKLNDRKLAQRQAGRRQGWQDEAWAFFDEVPEIKFAVQFRGNAMGKLVIYAGIRMPDQPADAAPLPVDHEDSDLGADLAASAKAELARLRNPLGGQASILTRLDMNLSVCGECWLVGRGERVDDVAGEVTPESWAIRSVSEVEVRNGVYKIKADPGDTKGEILDAELDTCIRLWQQHARWEQLADCDMRALLGEAKTLQVLSQQVMAQAMRAASAGFVTIPNELGFGPADPTEPEDGEDAVADPLLDTFAQVLLNPIEDPSDPSSVQPGIIRGPAEHLKPDVLRRITMHDPSIDASLEERIRARIERIARGLNLPVEVVMGHMSTTFANAEQVDQDTFEDFLQPRCQLICDALTYGFLRPNLIDAGYAPEDVDRIVVWYDPAALVAQPNVETNAMPAWTAGLISDSTARAALGFSDDDAAEPLELIIRTGLRRGILTAELTAALIQDLADEAGVELPSPDELLAGEPAGGDGANANARAQLRAIASLMLMRGQGQQQPPAVTAAAIPPPAPRLALTAARRRPSYGRQLMDIDRELRTRLTIAANDAMGRALERAGNRMRSRATTDMRNRLRGVPPYRVAAALWTAEPSDALVAAADDALDGAWDELESQFREWGAGAQDDAIEVASRAAAGFTTAERRSLKLRQAGDLDEAWGWLSNALRTAAGARMFNPDPVAPLVGEFDPNLRVPTGMLRSALARAGGATGITTTEQGGAFITLGNAGTTPVGGIGTGQLIGEAMTGHGVGIEGYVWVYGPAFRKHPFEPHADLDGTPFVNFDDAVLASDGTFGNPFWMPGDHSGCICDFEPVILSADEAA